MQGFIIVCFDVKCAFSFLELYLPILHIHIPPEMGGTRVADVVGSIPAFQAGWAGSNPVRRSMAGKRPTYGLRLVSEYTAKEVKLPSPAFAPPQSA